MRYGLTLAMVGTAFGVRLAAGPWLEGTAPFTLFYVPILASAAMFANGSGYLAAASSSALCLYFLPPYGEFGWPNNTPSTISFALFGGCAALTASVVETLHHAMREQRSAIHHRTLLLVEFRHRSRNDLASVGALLLLRRRLVQAIEAKQALKEAADHTTDLARIHSRLEDATHDPAGIPVVDTGKFVIGLCADMVPPVVGAVADNLSLPTERAMQLGLILCEMIRDSRSQPDAVVTVTFQGRHGEFVLQVADDRGELAPGDSLRTRMCSLLARQLRGSFERVNPGTGGSVGILRFPIEAPTLAAARVGL